MKLLGILLVIVLSLTGCFVLGYSLRDLRELRLPTGDKMAKMLGAPAAEAEVAPKLLFKSAFEKIRRDFFKPVSRKQLRSAGMQGLVAALGDPHTMFFDPDTSKDFRIETEGNFVGIGARLSPNPNGALVVVVFRKGPAEQAGLRVGDIVTSVDGKPVAGMAVEDIVKLIRGTEGTSVRLKIARVGEKKPLTLVAMRAQVVMPSVESEVISGAGIGYVSVSSFSANTTEQFDLALQRMQDARVKGLVIDLRGNGGGLLDTAKEMLSRFVEDKLIVKLKMADGAVSEERTMLGYKKNLNIPIVVLLNSESASASEIFAGVLGDYKIATLVGEHTFGKMSVQNLFVLLDSSSAKITIARYYIPSGRDFSRKVDEDGVYVGGGLAPDILVKYRPLPKKDPKSIVPNDTQLQRAIQVIREKTAA